MSLITQIKPQKNKKRVNIYLDGKFSFGLDLENFMKLKLSVGRQLSDQEIKEIIQKAEFKKSLDTLLRFATLRPRSEKEIRDWFRRRKVHQSLHKKLFNRLKRLELVDDEGFARWWVNQRLQFKFKSKRELRHELRMKGIDKDIVNQVIGESVDREKEIEMAIRLVEKKAYRWGKLDKAEGKRKMSEYLGRKGFGWEVIKVAVDKLGGN